MLIEKFIRAGFKGEPNCHACGAPAVIEMCDYSDGFSFLCADHAMQLARKIMEDLCELLTRGGRYG